MHPIAHLSPAPNRADQIRALQQAVADAGADIDGTLALIADAALAMIPVALGVVVRLGQGAAMRQAVAGVGQVPVAIVPILRRGVEVGDIRVHARCGLSADDHDLLHLLAGIAAIVLAAERLADHAYDALDRYQRRFHATFSQAPVGIAHVSPEGRFLLVNDQFAAITGHSREALLQHGFQRITHPDDLDADTAHVLRLLSGDVDRYDMEKRYLRPDGTDVWVRLTVSLVRDTVGAPDFFVSVIEDMSAIRAAHEQALRDPLTGLLNRRGLHEWGEVLLRRAGKSDTDLWIVYLDLDGFKQVNDTQGHRAGDRCLIAVARAIEEEVGASGMAARLGGDEFAILMRMDGRSAEARVERLRVALTHLPEGVSGSFGLLSLSSRPGLDIERLIALADEAMFAAKRAGRNCVRTVR